MNRGTSDTTLILNNRDQILTGHDQQSSTGIHMLMPLYTSTRSGPKSTICQVNMSNYRILALLCLFLLTAVVGFIGIYAFD